MAGQNGQAPRAGLEPAAYCLGGTIRAWLDEAGCRLMRYLPAATIAGRGWGAPEACRRWLPVWLPEISLAPLTLMSQLLTEDAGAAMAVARPARTDLFVHVADRHVSDRRQIRSVAAIRQPGRQRAAPALPQCALHPARSTPGHAAARVISRPYKVTRAC